MFGSKRKTLKEKKEEGRKRTEKEMDKCFREGKKIHQGEVGKYLVKEKNPRKHIFQLISKCFSIYRALWICFCAKEVLVDCWRSNFGNCQHEELLSAFRLSSVSRQCTCPQWLDEGWGIIHQRHWLNARQNCTSPLFGIGLGYTPYFGMPPTPQFRGSALVLNG